MSDAVLNVVAGRLVAARSGATLTRTEPATGMPAAPVAASSGEDIHEAVVAAAEAFPAWAARPSADRARLLTRLADLIDRDAEALAQAESRDTGKPIALCRRMDIPRSAANLRFFAGAVQHQALEAYETDQPAPAGRADAGPERALNLTLRRPRGVAGLISPWNLPLYLLTWKIAPALASGNTAVAKPSEITPTTATMLGQLALEAGVPAGVLNIVHGAGAAAGAALVTHPLVPAVSFTGSTAVGRWIGRACGERLKRVSLELGGKNALIIADDADFEAALDTAARAAFTNQGQICLCASRVLVHRSILPRVIEGLLARAASLRIGDPAEEATDFGALTSAAHLAKVEAYADLARALGGTIHAGGTRVDPARLPARCRGGAFFSPTVVSGLDAGCRVEQEEIFGPIITLRAFDDDEEAIALANGTPYGLAASVWTRSLRRAHVFAERLQAGVIWVNCWLLRDLRTPFGGVKQSGVGREGGSEALRFFTEPRNACFRL